MLPTISNEDGELSVRAPVTNLAANCRPLGTSPRDLFEVCAPPPPSFFSRLKTWPHTIEPAATTQPEELLTEILLPEIMGEESLPPSCPLV